MSWCASFVSHLFSLCQHRIIGNDCRLPCKWSRKSLRHMHFSRGWRAEHRTTSIICARMYPIHLYQSKHFYEMNHLFYRTYIIGKLWGPSALRHLIMHVTDLADYIWVLTGIPTPFSCLSTIAFRFATRMKSAEGLSIAKWWPSLAAPARKPQRTS
jgi:hypothetical protein